MTGDTSVPLKVPDESSASPARLRIRALPSLLVNQIAAGEVVERPASVVKELVDNAIDAGATRIRVELEQGGVELIRVSDDGVGMAPEDLPLALAPHATSKITRAEDLEAIPTLGFRGEALASITSVARVSIRSRMRGSESAHRIDASGDAINTVQPDAGAPGTVVTVRNLFFNTPARRKFLRSPGTEQGHCVAIVRDLAMAQPNLGFELVCDGRVLLDVPPMQDPRSRAVAILGAELADHLLEAESEPLESAHVLVWGLVGTPSIAKPTNKGQHIFVNGRPVRDRTIQHALNEAYRGLLDPSRKPVAVLLIELDPSMVDVNVHPTKAEVRFRDSGRVHSAVYNAVRRALQQADLTPEWQDVRRSESAPQVMTTGWTPPRDWSAAAFAQTIQTHLADAGAAIDFDALRTAVERSAPVTEHAATPLVPTRAAERVLQVHDSYLVTQDDQGVIIIDQHALHERVMFEKIFARLSEGPLESQRLLTPATFDTSRAHIDALAPLQPMLERIGVEAEPIGPAAIAIHAFPTLLFQRKVEPGAFLSELLERAAASDLPTGQEEALHEIVDMMACKAAIKAGDRLSDEELAEVLAFRERVERSSSCPHGRPTTIRLTLRDLERRFGRR